MASHPTGAGGESLERSDWFEDLVAPIERFIEASTDEARSIGDGIRRTFSAERMEQAFQTLRQRLRRETVSTASDASSDGTTLCAADPSDPSSMLAELERPELILRRQVRARETAHTIEQWDRHLCDPPQLDLW